MNQLNFLSGVLLLSSGVAWAEPKVVVEHHSAGEASAAFKFASVPAPSRSDLAAAARFSLVDGRADPNSGGLEKLYDGKLPGEEDQPEENFFFAAGTDGGRIRVDLGTNVAIAQVNSYSWHPGSRGPQVYSLFASDGGAANFKADPKRGSDPAQSGWKLVAKVDTRPKSGGPGGQYGVSISDPSGALGNYRYLLLDVSRTEDDDGFGNTFYSELDVVATGTTPLPANTEAAPPFVTHSTDGACEISIDTSGAPELKDWAEQKLAPVLAEWYPKLVALLPSEGYTPPKSFSVLIRPGRGVAATGGARNTANANWLKQELKGEAVGALVHEEVHVIQRYGGGRRANPDAPRVRPPGWLVEGIPDYIRWFQFEPQSHGADLVWMRTRKNLSLRYDSGYRISANFLNYVVEKYDPKLITALNAACRDGKYNEEIWKERTGKTLTELSDEWKATTEKALGNGQSPG